MIIEKHDGITIVTGTPDQLRGWQTALHTADPNLPLQDNPRTITLHAQEPGTPTDPGTKTQSQSGINTRASLHLVPMIAVSLILTLATVIGLVQIGRWVYEQFF
jgi:hypothetical protein